MQQCRLFGPHSPAEDGEIAPLYDPSGTFDLITLSSDSEEFETPSPMLTSGDRDISYRFRAGGPITPIVGNNMSMPIANQSVTEDVLPPVEGTELERSLLSMIEEETDTLPFSPVSTVDLQYEEDANLINGAIPPMANIVPPPTVPVSPRVINIVPPTLPVMMPHIPVLHSIAGYCAACGVTFDQIAVESMNAYIASTEYPGETVRDRSVRARAFLDGIDAGLVMFQTGGLSQGTTCAGTSSNSRNDQHRGRSR